MTEPDITERFLARELLSASTLDEARGLLTRYAGSCRPYTLLHELDVLRDRLASAGQPAEAALAEFHRQTVQDLRGFLTGCVRTDRPVARARQNLAAGLPESVDEPRARLEQEAAGLMQRGDLDAALAVLRRASSIPPIAEEVPRLAGLRMTLAHELRSRGRYGDALAALDTVDFGPRSGGALAGEISGSLGRVSASACMTAVRTGRRSTQAGAPARLANRDADARGDFSRVNGPP